MISHHAFKKLSGHTISIYIALILVTAIAPVWAQTSNEIENPQSGSIGLEGVVEGEPPTQAAQINSPTEGQTFTQTPIAVEGTCQANQIVEVYKNDTFAGSVFCRDNNTFSVNISLFYGENLLYTKVRDLLGQTGPQSNTVTVFYEPAVTESGRQIGQQLFLLSTVSYRGALPGTEIDFPLRLSGGAGPYAINVNWGDNASDVRSRSDTGEFTLSHTYERPGVYPVVIKASDDTGQTAFLQLTAVVDGEIDGGLQEQEALSPQAEKEYVSWPVYVLLTLVPLAYWMGTRYEKRRYRFK